ncbi:MAG: YhjD/YihY/BrkB family envelope integrity protein [Tepidisphaeraceae bacterium]
MAGIKDLVHVIQSHGPVELGKRVYAEVNRDNVFTNAAAIAYAWVFAIFPMVIFLMTLVPYLPQRFREQVPYKIAELMYQSGMTWSIVDPVQKLAESLLNETSRGLLSFGLLLTLYAASGGMNTTMAALDTALDIEKPRPFWLKRLFAMLLTVFMGGAFLIVLLMLPIGSIATKLLTEHASALPTRRRGGSILR